MYYNIDEMQTVLIRRSLGKHDGFRGVEVSVCETEYRQELLVRIT
jgi:hypothetical protein